MKQIVCGDGAWLAVPYKARIPGFPRKSIGEGASSWESLTCPQLSAIAYDCRHFAAKVPLRKGPKKGAHCAQIAESGLKPPLGAPIWTFPKCNLGVALEQETILRLSGPRRKDYLLLLLSIFREIQEFGPRTRQSGSQLEGVLCSMNAMKRRGESDEDSSLHRFAIFYEDSPGP